MYLKAITQFKEILDDFEFLLHQNHKAFRWALKDQKSPLDFDVSFKAVIPQKAIFDYYRSDVCIRCSRRISYKPDQFSEVKPKLPYLILKHNVFLGKYNRIYHDPEVDREFSQIIKLAIGYEADHFLIREVLRCHFGAEEINDPQWPENCKKNIQDDIIKFNLKGILIIGEAARILLQDKAKDHFSKVFHFLNLPTVATPGPSRLIFMKRKSYSLTKIKEERDRIIKTIQLFRDKIIQKLN